MKIRNKIFGKDWLANIDEYKIVESYIYEIFTKTLHKLDNNAENWSIPFFNVYFFEGDAEMNGNPIFSAKNNIQQYIIRVVVDEDSDGWSTWTDDFDDIPLYTIYLNSEYINEIELFFHQVIKTQNI